MTNEHSHSLSTPFSKPTNNHLAHIHTSILPSAITSQRKHNTHSYTLHTCCTHFHRNPIVHKNLRTVTHNILQPHNSVSFVFEEHLISPWACTSAPQFYLRWKRTVHLMARWITCTFSFLIYIQVFPSKSLIKPDQELETSALEYLTSLEHTFFFMKYCWILSPFLDVLNTHN